MFFSSLNSFGISYLAVPVSDTTEEDIASTFSTCLPWIHRALVGGGRVLVNCWVGRSR